MDSSNYSSYKAEGTPRYIGGLFQNLQFIFRYLILDTGMIVDFQGLQGSARTSVRVLPKAFEAHSKLHVSSSSLVQQRYITFDLWNPKYTEI
ncbi:MAG: DUF1883 domain-containing protein [bacterium]|nr:DUF1883 domain-containing protein [bacterium]